MTVAALAGGEGYRHVEWYRGSDWLGLSLGGLFLFGALCLSLIVTRYFYRRKGPAAAICYPLAFWTGMLLAGLAVTKGKLGWQSLASLGLAVAVSMGYGVYLSARRRDLRITPEDKEKQKPPPPTRKCPACGLEIDSRAGKCPACEAETD